MSTQHNEHTVNGAADEMRDCGGEPQTALGGGNTEAGMAVEVREGFVCDFPFEALPVAAWVSRAKRISTHTIGRAFTGHSFGLGGVWPFTTSTNALAVNWLPWSVLTMSGLP